MQAITRRDTLKQGLSLAGFLALADWAIPALAQGATDVPFTDYPANFAPGGNGAPRRTFDIRTIDGFTVPKDKFFVTQHNNQPEIDPNAYRLKLTGMVNKPAELSLAGSAQDAQPRIWSSAMSVPATARAAFKGWLRADDSRAFRCATF